MTRPLFFGSSEQALFGVHHPARAAAARGAGVVLCYPGVQEYNMTHWAFRKLAGMLSREGFDVLRFDYRGTGDSAGEPLEANRATWLADIQTAVRELRDMTGVQPVSLLGMRLGAALAALVSREMAVDDLVLWEPVVQGRRYIEELEEQQARRKLVLLHGRWPEDREELMGFPFPPSMREDIGSIDLRAAPPIKARRVLVLVAQERPAHVELVEALRSAGNVVQYRVVPEETQVDPSTREAALLSNRILVAMTEGLSARRE